MNRHTYKIEEGPLSIGDIGVYALVDYIRTNGVENGKIIKLHPHTFDELALDHRKQYGESISQPFALLGVPIQADEHGRVPMDRIVIASELPERWVRIIDMPNSPAAEVIFRCGWCGNLVGEKGVLLDPETRQQKIETLESHHNKVQTVNGHCCKAEWLHE